MHKPHPCVQSRLKSLTLWVPFFFCAALVASGARAQSFCFLSAVTYYEQVYCELQAKGEARSLPPFHQFKRNDERIQASLLKRPAARVGIDLPLPAKVAPSSAPPASISPTPARAPDVANSRPPPAVARETSGLDVCEMVEDIVSCGDSARFRLMGNRLNHRLTASALTEDNQMALPSFAGDAKDAQAVNRYLFAAYRQYLAKMHEIGLAGATTTYARFAFLFYDLHEKGLNFSQRFETMYGFLKKDKATMGVSEKLSVDPQLQLSDCDLFPGELLVCSRAGRNYLYMAVSD